MNSEPKKNPLWTRDFTIITLGSVVSLLGSQLSGFAMSLMVLDYTESTLLFALYNILYMLPSALAPVLVGPFLDRFSRKKTIYTLDFITSGLFAALAIFIWRGTFSFPVLAAATFLMGAIGGVYSVAYQSFYPLTITEGNFQKAYAVASTLETLTVVMVPVSAFVYKAFGIVPLFAANSVTFFIAAAVETRLRTEEKYTEMDRSGGIRRFTSDFKEGLQYLMSEKGLMRIAVYFLFSSLVGGVTGIVTLPWFREAFPEGLGSLSFLAPVAEFLGAADGGEYVYMLVWGMSTLARAVGGVIHYRLKLPAKAKYAITLAVYISLYVLESAYLFVPIPIMMVFLFTDGLLGVTSYNIRISATQSYVPDEKKGRFNGVFVTLSTVGVLVGEALAGLMSLGMSSRAIIIAVNLVGLAAAIAIIGTGRRDIEKIYNKEA